MRIKYEPVTKPNGDSYVLITEITGFPTYDECPYEYLNIRDHVYLRENGALGQPTHDIGVVKILVIGEEYPWSRFQSILDNIITPAMKALNSIRKKQKEYAQEMKKSGMVWKFKEDRVPTEDDWRDYL